MSLHPNEIKYREMQRVFHYSRDTHFSGWVLATYRSMDGVIRCVVETERGLTFITDQGNLKSVEECNGTAISRNLGSAA